MTQTPLFLASIALAICSLQAAQTRPIAEVSKPETALPTVTVRLYNMANASTEEIMGATEEASEILTRAGVALAWADCTGPIREPLCGQVDGPATLNLRLAPSSLAPADLPPGIFGFALMSTAGGFARTANVYFDRVGAIADGRKYRHAVILGAMMAHEIGHLLLGQGSHSKYGLMSLPGGPKVLTAADRGMLSFSEREAKAIQQAAAKRLIASSTPPIPIADGSKHPGQADGTPASAVGLPRVALDPQLTVGVDGDAEIEPKVLERTRTEASRVLATAGVAVRSEQCGTSAKETGQDASQDASCAQRADAAAPVTEGLEPAARVLTVRIYNYAGVDAELVTEAAGMAREIYLRSGVETRWTLCELPGVESVFDEPCAGGQAADTIQMRIVEAAPKDQEGVHKTVFGFALPSKAGFGTMASAFWDRIAETANKSKVTPAQLLASVMAHEAGHLLLGFNSHSAEGMMSGRWDDRRFTSISQGGLVFIGKQKNRIQNGAAARLAAGR